MTPRTALLAVGAVEALILAIVLIAGAIAIAAGHLSWEDWLQDVIILAGALGIGTGIACAGYAYRNGSHPPETPPPTPVRRPYAGKLDE